MLASLFEECCHHPTEIGSAIFTASLPRKIPLHDSQAIASRVEPEELLHKFLSLN